MPVKRRIARVRRADLETLTPDQERALLTGSGLFGDAFPNDATFAAAWEIHADRLLAEYIAKYPGQRPYAWWRLESKVPHPPYLDPADAGKYPPFVWKIVNRDFADVTEPQETYLRRTGQLTPVEIEVLDDPALDS